MLSVIGTFLVRSGILTSVHTFALDPTRGTYILMFIGILGAYSLFLYAIHSKRFIEKNYVSFLSREGSILLNNILMIVVCSSVFLGTIYPLLVEAISGDKISVGEPYYNSTIVPIIIPAILVMGIGPLLSWKKINIRKTFKKILPSILITIIATYMFTFFYKFVDVIGVIGIALSCWVIANTIFTKRNSPKLPTSTMIAHLGVGILILGITGSSVWQKEKIIRMNINDKTIISKYDVIFKEVKEMVGSSECL